MAVLFGFLMQVFLAGSVKRRIITFAVSAVFVGVAIPYLLWLNFFRYPQLGLVGIVVLSLAVALSGTAMTVGVRNKAVLYPALITVGLGIILYYATFSILAGAQHPGADHRRRALAWPSPAPSATTWAAACARSPCGSVPSPAWPLPA